MQIRLYSKDSTLYTIIRNPVNETLICGEIKSSKCIKRKSFFSFDYNKELEKTLNSNDYSFYFCVWVDKHPTSMLSEQIKVGKTYWTIVNGNKIEWNITDTVKLNELRNYILDNYCKN